MIDVKQINGLLKEYKIQEDGTQIMTIILMKKKLINIDEVRLMFDQYTKYRFAHNVKHFGTEEKYISKDNQLSSFYDFINRAQYKQDFKLPKTTLTEYLFDDKDFYELVARHDTIMKTLQAKRDKNVANYKRENNIST